MLNQSGITKQTFGGTTQILVNVKLQVSIGIVVASALGVTVGAKKIVKAGTPLAGNIETPAIPFTLGVGSGNNNTTVGILLHDVDVTAGNANGTLLLFGFVNLNRLDPLVIARTNVDVKKALQARITYLSV